MRYLFIFIWLIWFLSEIFLNRLFRSKMSNSKELDKNSLQYIWVVIFVSITLGIFSSIYLDIPILGMNLLRYLGLALIVTGIIIRLLAIRTLGKFFTVNLAVQDDHKLISNGFYKYIRHPSYSGSLLSFLGFGFSLNNWPALLVIFIPILLSFMYRIKVEEKLLVENLGDEYLEYKSKTKQLIPFIY